MIEPQDQLSRILNCLNKNRYLTSQQVRRKSKIIHAETHLSRLLSEGLVERKKLKMRNIKRLINGYKLGLPFKDNNTKYINYNDYKIS